MLRAFSTAFLLLVLSAAGSAATDSPVRRYLVDARVHLSVILWESGPRGELSWRDTVTGAAGEIPFECRGSRLVTRKGRGSSVEAQLLPDLAIVVRNPPWSEGSQRLALGVALD